MPRTPRQPLLLILGLIVSMVGTTSPAAAAVLAVDRVSGTNRYETAVAISETSWPLGATVAFVATGENFADSVAVTAVGGNVGPILLTRPGSLPEATADELRRLDPEIVIVLGGPNAISDDVQLAIAQALTGMGVVVDRVFGKNRFETSVAISQELHEGASVVYLADGRDYVAGITAAASAGVNGGVVLTTPKDSLHTSVANELARLNPTLLVAVGDLDASVVSRASNFAAEVQWIQGSSAEDLSARVSAATWASTEDVLVASADNFPDALASAAWAVGANVPLLLTDPAKLEAATACEILRLRATGAVITGGPRAVTSTVERSLADIKPREFGCSDPIMIVIPDPDPNTEVREVTLYELATSPDGTRAYVVNNSWNSVEVIDVIDGVWLGRISVGSNPTDIDISADGKRLYVVNNGSQTISVLDTTASFESAEIEQVPMVYAGANGRRTLSIEASSDGNSFVIPARLEAADSAACLQILGANLTMTELEPGTDFNIPHAAVQGFSSADHKMVGVIAPDRGTEPHADLPCVEGSEPEPEPTPTETDGPAPDPADEVQPLALFTYIDGVWTRVGAWGRSVSEIGYGQITENGLTGDGGGTYTVFEAVDRSAVLGTVTSESNATYGLAVSPLQPNCPENRGNPAKCTQVAYSVTSGADGTGLVDIIDITAGLNVAGSFRVIDQIPLQSLVGAYGGKNQPSDVTIQNQAVVTSDARSLVVATEFTVEVLPIG